MAVEHDLDCGIFELPAGVEPTCKGCRHDLGLPPLDSPRDQTAVPPSVASVVSEAPLPNGEHTTSKGKRRKKQKAATEGASAEAAPAAPQPETGQERKAVEKGQGPEEPLPDEGCPEFIANGTKYKKKILPYPMGRIISDIERLADNWPRRVGDALFVPNEGEGVSWLRSSAALFGYLGTKTGPPAWYKAPGCHNREEVFHELRRTATKYRAVETLPHCPTLPSHYYSCSFPQPGDGSALRELTGKYCPATSIDGDLILSAFATVLWGGPDGARPAFCFASDDGRGAGKSAVSAGVGRFGGGAIELSAGENSEVMRQRLLSPEGLKKRVVRLDNVKSLKFSWAELESLITAPEISGKQLYVGEASRPNSLLWILTLNGPALGEDLAQRCVIVKLKKPVHRSGWEEEVNSFIDANRKALIADCIGFFQRPAATLKQFSRWGTWERAVLARLPDPSEAQRLILERQGEANVETEEHEIIESYFEKRLAALSYNTATDVVRIPTEIVAQWYNAAMNEKHRTAAVSRILNQGAEEKKLHRIRPDPCRTFGRCFLWVGTDSTPSAFTCNDLEERINSNGYTYAR
jgi:hypothetical protein